MPRQPILDPRYFRLDDLLRRPLASGDTLGSGGGDLSASTVSGWGFSGAAIFRGVEVPAPMTISVWVEGAPVFPAEGVYRPSHVTVNAQDADTGLQVSEDKFVGADDCLVSVVSLRNPGEWSIEVETRTQWGIAKGEHGGETGAPFYVSRFAPPAPDRRITLPAGGRVRLVFVLAFAADDRFARVPGDTARSHAEGYARDNAAVVAHVQGFDAWATRHVTRFDSPDPWATRAWFHDVFLRRKFPTRVPVAVPDALQTRAGFVEEARSRFAGGDFDAPTDAPAPFLPDVFVRQVLGLSVSGDALSLSPAPDLSDWHYFAVENYEHDGRRFTFVWDDPETPGDAFDDGDKGFTVYDGDAVIHRQSDLSAFTAPLAAPSPLGDDEDD
ncbi:MAG: hypothetical protein H7Y38_19585 [Armatimonadetes bacterium]|nr:hypothetical protein [Armatimonadota bacterium]